MTGQAIVLLVLLGAASAASLLYFLRRRRFRASGEAGASSPARVAAGESCQAKPMGESTNNPSASFQAIETAKEEPGLVTDRHDEAAVPVENSHSRSVIDEEERRRRETEVAPTPSAEEFRDVDASEPELQPVPPLDPTSTSGSSGSDEEVPHLTPRTSSQESADSTLAVRVDQVTVENAGATSGGGLFERHEGKASEEESSETGVSADRHDSEETTVSTTVPAVLEAGSDIDVGQKVKAPEEAQPAAGALPTTRSAPDSNPPVQAPVREGAALTQQSEEVAGEGGLDVEEEAEEDAVPPSLDMPRRKERNARIKKPRKYEGLAHSAPQPGDPKQRGRHADGEEAAPRDRSLPLEVRLRFDRSGFCRLSLIARRSNGLPEKITVSTQSVELELQAMQDEWYEDVSADDIARILEEGAVWTQKESSEQHTWLLSGRPLYVLADRADISGFVSQARLKLGRAHVVLCKAAIRNAVEDAIKKTGATSTSILDKSLGVPAGWIVFRGVVPTLPVTPVCDADVFNALRPLPGIEISLEAGIRLEYANWLEGYPPMIKVYGDPEHTAEVLIDGKAAERGVDGCFRAPGWDSIGSHTIWCSGVSKTYSVVRFASTWEPWDAYAFPVSCGSERRIAICGPLLRCASDEIQSRFVSVTVPEANPVLLGRAPGQQVLAESASGIRGAPLIASPPFSPVWALPRDPVHCDKKTARILLVGDMASPDLASGNPMQCGVLRNRSMEAWCRFILDAGRKGIRTEPDTENIRALWRQYKLLARRIWRSRK